LIIPIFRLDWHYAVFGLYVIGVGFQFFAFIGYLFVLCKEKNLACYRFHDVVLIIGCKSCRL